MGIHLNPKEHVMRNLRKIIGSAGALAVVAVAFGVQAGFGAAPSAPSSIVTVDPARILDTRIALGVPGSTPVGPASTITVQVTGVGGVPANATGVVVTITGTEATQSTFVTATPTGSPRSTTSVLNVSPNVDIANTITVALGTNGKIDLYNNGGNVHLIADVTGYLLPDAFGGAPTTTTDPTPTVVEKVLEITTMQAGGVGALNPDPSTGCVNLGANGNVYFDVPIPVGSSVKTVDFRYYDNEAMNSQTFLLYEVDQLTPTQTPTAAGTLSDNQLPTPNAFLGYNTLRMTPVGADKVSDKIHYYLAAFTVGAVAGQQWFCGASVTYQYLES
jgi:hypothetical protein